MNKHIPNEIVAKLFDKKRFTQEDFFKLTNTLISLLVLKLTISLGGEKLLAIVAMNNIIRIDMSDTYKEE